VLAGTRGCEASRPCSTERGASIDEGSPSGGAFCARRVSSEVLRSRIQAVRVSADTRRSDW
jgi:hypothetical protein